MGYLPHPQVPLGHLRPNDIFLLLFMGALWEFITRFMLLRYKAKPLKLKQRANNLQVLELKVKAARNKGPSAFVETSKLERQLLAEEKALAEITEQRKLKQTQMKKRMKIANYSVSALIFAMWYSIPIMEFAAHRIETTEVLSAEEGQDFAISAFKAFLFPISVVGVGLKVSKWGLNNPKTSSGALLVFWSAQTTVAKIMDAVDALAA